MVNIVRGPGKTELQQFSPGHFWFVLSEQYDKPYAMKERFKKLYPYFIDVWQYVVIIVIMAIAAIFIL